MVLYPLSSLMKGGKILGDGTYGMVRTMDDALGELKEFPIPNISNVNITLVQYNKTRHSLEFIQRRLQKFVNTHGNDLVFKKPKMNEQKDAYTELYKMRIIIDAATPFNIIYKIQPSRKAERYIFGFELNKQFYLVYQKMDGTLHDLFKKTKNEQGLHRDWLKQCKDDTRQFLNALHTYGYAHNDIKANNILYKHDPSDPNRISFYVGDYGTITPRDRKISQSTHIDLKDTDIANMGSVIHSMQQFIENTHQHVHPEERPNTLSSHSQMNLPPGEDLSNSTKHSRSNGRSNGRSISSSMAN